jgi:glycosyltransferase involved in cell wall biosynthesis
MIAPPAIGKEAYYNSLIKKIRSVENIVYYDFVENDKIYELLIKSKVFCITSDIEGDWPMVVLEAAAVGVPILSLKINYDDLIDTYSGGIYCNSDITVMMEKFELLVSDSELNRNLSENAVRYIYENHDIGENVKRLFKEISVK